LLFLFGNGIGPLQWDPSSQRVERPKVAVVEIYGAPGTRVPRLVLFN